MIEYHNINQLYLNYDIFRFDRFVYHHLLVLLNLNFWIGLNWFYSTTINKCEENYEHNLSEWAAITGNCANYGENKIFESIAHFTGTYFINEQDDPALLGVLFGSNNINETGCGIIATYNVLMANCRITQNKFPELIMLFEKKNLFFGSLGALPSHVCEVLSEYFDMEDNIQVVNNADDVTGSSSLLHSQTIEYGLVATYFNNSLGARSSVSPFERALQMHTVCIVFDKNENNVDYYYVLNDSPHTRLVCDLFSCIDPYYCVEFETGLFFEVNENESD